MAEAMNIPNVMTFDVVKEKDVFEQALKDALAKDELTVIIARRPCILAAARLGAQKKAEGGAQ